MNEYNSTTETSVKNPVKKTKRLSFDKRIALRRNQEKAVAPTRNKKDNQDDNERIEELMRTYSASTDLVSLD